MKSKFKQLDLNSSIIVVGLIRCRYTFMFHSQRFDIQFPVSIQPSVMLQNLSLIKGFVGVHFLYFDVFDPFKEFAKMFKFPVRM